MLLQLLVLTRVLAVPKLFPKLLPKLKVSATVLADPKLKSFGNRSGTAAKTNGFGNGFSSSKTKGFRTPKTIAKTFSFRNGFKGL
jgi:hypothetical protein